MQVKDLTERIAGLLEPLIPPGSSVLLALSGGMDSVVLLHLLHALAGRFTWRLSALHVHHGISPHAASWAAFCTDLCTRLAIPLQIEHVDIAPLRQLGIEAAARKLRHAALDRQPVQFIALAHHQDDQAETLLLQLLRGAGVRGASAMPQFKQRGTLPNQLRPLLNVARSELLAYSQQHCLQWIEDESNTDVAYPRNFMRHQVLPLLEQRFPAYRETLTRSASHFAEASELLDQLAQQDEHFISSTDAKYGGEAGEKFLHVAQLKQLSHPRAKNLLRYFLHRMGAPSPQLVHLDEMLQQLCHARQDAKVLLGWGDWQIRRYRGKIYATQPLAEPLGELCVQWRGEASLELTVLHGTLHFETTIGQGLDLQKLQQGRVTVRLRHGAERIRLHAKSASRTLKNLLQERGIPPWQRDTLPLLFCDETLVAVCGIGVESQFHVAHDQAGITLRWSAAS
jgi:tRNA(Ile)-lysidine synthase